jgi:hypothetical protein
MRIVVYARLDSLVGRGQNPNCRLSSIISYICKPSTQAQAQALAIGAGLPL